MVKRLAPARTAATGARFTMGALWRAHLWDGAHG